MLHTPGRALPCPSWPQCVLRCCPVCPVGGPAPSPGTCCCGGPGREGGEGRREGGGEGGREGGREGGGGGEGGGEGGRKREGLHPEFSYMYMNCIYSNFMNGSNTSAVKLLPACMPAYIVSLCTVSKMSWISLVLRTHNTSTCP